MLLGKSIVLSPLDLRFNCALGGSGLSTISYKSGGQCGCPRLTSHPAAWLQTPHPLCPNLDVKV